ncbi:hypothetical protein R1sor_010443 [Riccia sorocarpa]|uniref:Uncharacterized protein n=1 Tax=Riccia sorocarpa TaxID=122646 RepID=A0ABD3I0T5_9MARC
MQPCDMAGSISVSLPPAWVDISDEVSTEMNKLKSRMAELAKSHGRALMVSFDDSTGEQQTIELLTAEITRSLKKCEQNLQRLSGGQGNSGDENLRKNVQEYVQDKIIVLQVASAIVDEIPLLPFLL